MKKSIAAQAPPHTNGHDKNKQILPENLLSCGCDKTQAGGHPIWNCWQDLDAMAFSRIMENFERGGKLKIMLSSCNQCKNPLDIQFVLTAPKAPTGPLILFP